MKRISILQGATVLTVALLVAPVAVFAEATTPAQAPAPSQAKTLAKTEAPAREGNIWDWRAHQPTEGQVEQQEKAAGVAPTPSEKATEAATLDDIYRQLVHQPSDISK
jgi:hypothetical protein